MMSWIFDFYNAFQYLFRRSAGWPNPTVCVNLISNNELLQFAGLYNYLCSRPIFWASVVGHGLLSSEGFVQGSYHDRLRTAAATQPLRVLRCRRAPKPVGYLSNTETCTATEWCYQQKYLAVAPHSYFSQHRLATHVCIIIVYDADHVTARCLRLQLSQSLFLRFGSHDEHRLIVISRLLYSHT